MVRSTLMVLAAFAVVIVGLADTPRVTGNAGGATYKGSATCKMCHKLMHKTIVEAYEKGAHPKAMQKASDAGAIVGDFASNSVFTKDKAAYTLGRGRNKQASKTYRLTTYAARVSLTCWTAALTSWPSRSCLVTSAFPQRRFTRKFLWKG